MQQRVIQKLALVLGLVMLMSACSTPFKYHSSSRDPEPSDDLRRYATLHPEISAMPLHVSRYKPVYSRSRYELHSPMAETKRSKSDMIWAGRHQRGWFSGLRWRLEF